MKFRTVAVCVFLAAVVLGYFLPPILRERGIAMPQLTPSPVGWCCVDDGKSCVASRASAACFAQGGTMFDTHKDVCDRACAAP